MMLELDDVVIDSLVQKQLFDTYSMLKDDFLSDTHSPMFTLDDEMDKEMQFNLINALRLVHNYFAPNRDRITW